MLRTTQYNFYVLAGDVFNFSTNCTYVKSFADGVTFNTCTYVYSRQCAARAVPNAAAAGGTLQSRTKARPQKKRLTNAASGQTCKSEE